MNSSCPLKVLVVPQNDIFFIEVLLISFLLFYIFILNRYLRHHMDVTNTVLNQFIDTWKTSSLSLVSILITLHLNPLVIPYYLAFGACEIINITRLITIAHMQAKMRDFFTLYLSRCPNKKIDLVMSDVCRITVIGLLFKGIWKNCIILENFVKQKYCRTRKFVYWRKE